MLVLSRRLAQEIVFPTLGIRIRVARIQGNTVRLGVDAPAGVEVFRAELLQEAGGSFNPPRSPSRLSAHELCNRLSKVTLPLHLLQRLLHGGRIDEAQSVLADVLAALGQLDRDWVMNTFAPRTTPPRFRTLIVDDDRNERELLAGLLSMHGCECRTAFDGQDALDQLMVEERPDFVLLDMRMPRRDGKQTLEAIRNDPRWRDIKVIGISPTTPEEMGIVRGPGGLDGWFPKPLDPRKLWECMQHEMAEAN